MTFAAPHTFTVGEVATAANLNLLTNDITAMLASSATVATSETTGSATFTDLTTSGPAVTMNTGDRTAVTVTIIAKMSNNTVDKVSLMAFAISGATTVIAADAQSIAAQSSTANAVYTVSGVYRVTGLTAGSNTFTAKYRATGNTSTFANRNLMVEL